MTLLPDWHLCVLRASQSGGDAAGIFRAVRRDPCTGHLDLGAERDGGY